MICYAKNTLSEYLERLSLREPVPGGGSAAALAGAMGASLLVMSARYSVGKGKGTVIERRFSKIIENALYIRDILTGIITSDSAAYLRVVAAKGSGSPSALKEANRKAAKVPLQLIKSCRILLRSVPFLKKEVTKYLASDVVAAEILLNAAIRAAQSMVEANQ